MPVIEVENLVKEFRSSKKERGVRGALRALFRPDRTLMRAVDGVSFEIRRGEIVGYIGPNGAGKSTTVKMMSGILTPTSGSVRVNGLSPESDRKRVVQNLGVVFGQRSQLYWDLRLGESFELLRRIYRIDEERYRANLRRMDEVLGISELSDRPVRQLSLGQRMRGDLAAAMLHSPSVLFLDEPTIGLDVEAKHAVRTVVREINAENGTTVILTTHDLDDIRELCSRIIILNRGRIIEDGSLSGIIGKIAPHRLLIVEFYEEPGEDFGVKAEVIRREGVRVWFRFDRDVSAAGLIEEISARRRIKDLSLEEPDIEDIIRQVYREAAPEAEPVSAI